MKPFIAKLLITLFALGLIAQPSISHAQSPFAQFNCDDLKTADTKVEDQQAAAVAGFETIHAVVNDLLKNLLIGRSLHYRLRCSPLITGIDESGQQSTSAYNVAKNLVNFGVLIILLVIAFANILRIKLDTYAVKKAVPLLLFGVVMANLGLPIIRTIVDFSEVLTATFIGQSSEGGTKTAFINELISAVYNGGAEKIGESIGNLSRGGSGGWPAALLLVGVGGFAFSAFGPFAIIVLVGGAFLIMIPAIMFFLLGLMFVARIYFLVILAAVSPLAFASLGFEPLRGKVWGWWWSHFIKWTFMVPATFALFWLGIVFYHSVGSTMDLGTYILILFLIYYAIQVPLKLGTSVMGAWNNSLVKPLGAALNRPFAAGRDYVAKAGPRDVSRYLSSKTTASLIPNARLRNWAASSKAGILTRIPLNPTKAVREGVGTFATITEDRNAANEKASRAAAVGVETGAFLANVGVQGRQGALNTARGYNLASTVEGRAELLALAEERIKQAGFDKDHDWSEDGYDQQKEKFNKMVETAIGSNNAKELGAILVAHSLLKNPEAPDALESAINKLKERGADTQQLYRFRDTINDRNGGGKITSDGTFDERYTKTVEKLRADLAGLDPKKQEEYLKKMVGQLTKAVGTLDNIREIEKNPNYKAWAKILLTEGRKHGDVKDATIPLERHRGQLNAVAIETIVKSMPTLAVAMQQTARATGENFQLEHLQPLLNGFDEAGFSNDLTPEQQFAAILAFEKHVEDIKKGTKKYLDSELAKAETEMQLKTGALKTMGNGLIGGVGTLPQKIDARALQAAGIVDPEQTSRVMNRLEWYNNIATSLDTLKNEQATNGPRIEELIKNHKGGGQPNANTP